MNKILHPTLDLVLQAAADCHRTLEARHIRHAIIGGLAVYLHGDVDRRPRDVDLLVRDEDAGMAMVKTVLGSSQYGWDDFRKAPLHPNGVRVEPHWDGKKTAKGKMRLPDPEAAQIDEIDSLAVIALNSLIEMKLARDLSSRDGQTDDTKHRRDVLALIRLNTLGESYADELDVPIRDQFLDLVRETRPRTGGQ